MGSQYLLVADVVVVVVVVRAVWIALCTSVMRLTCRDGNRYHIRYTVFSGVYECHAEIYQMYGTGGKSRKCHVAWKRGNIGPCSPRVYTGMSMVEQTDFVGSHERIETIEVPQAQGPKSRDLRIRKIHPGLCGHE